MFRTNFIGTVLVILLGVNLGAWTLSVATNSSASVSSVVVPIGAAAVDLRAQSASVDATAVPDTVQSVIDFTIPSSTVTTIPIAASSKHH